MYKLCIFIHPWVRVLSWRWEFMSLDYGFILPLRRALIWYRCWPCLIMHVLGFCEGSEWKLMIMESIVVGKWLMDVWRWSWKHWARGNQTQASLWFVFGNRGSNRAGGNSVRRTEFQDQARCAPGVRLQRACCAPKGRLERAWAEPQVQTGSIRASCALVTLRACCARESVLGWLFWTDKAEVAICI